MGINLIVNSDGNPPNIRITITPTNGATVTGITLTRTSYGTTNTTRVQPTPGPSPRIVDDYEAPWETGVTYTATVTTSSGSETFTSSTANLTPTVAWMIHPTTPSLSCILDTGSNATAGVVSIGAVTRQATTTVHEVLGSEYRIVTRTGNRAVARTQIVYATVTEQERARFTALVRDQTPILIREPGAYGWAFEDGYYDIGDVVEERFNPGYGAETRRNFTIPIEKVTSPAGTQQATRTWADVLAGNATWDDVTAGYATWTDLQTDNRR